MPTVEYTALSLYRRNRIKPWLDRTTGNNPNITADEVLEELRRETWRTITRRLSTLPTVRVNVFISAVLSELIDAAPRECLVALLLAVDLASSELASEAEAERIR